MKCLHVILRNDWFWYTGKIIIILHIVEVLTISKSSIKIKDIRMKKISEDFAYDQKCFPIGMKLLNIFANSLHTKKVWFNLSTIKSIEKN